MGKVKLTKDEKQKVQNVRITVKRELPVLLVIILLIAAIIGIIIWNPFSEKNDVVEEKTVITKSELEEVLHISGLSTYKVAFNGVATVKDDDKVLYHVAYEAEVSVGFDMEQIRVDLTVGGENEENKEVIVTLPKMEITDVAVDAGSLDYIFEKESANTDNVLKDAYPACKADAEEECNFNKALFDMAEENAVNFVRALLEPLLEPNEYSLKVVDEGGNSYE